MKKEVNPLKLPTASNLILVAAVVIIGAVFRKSYPSVGHWITVAGLAWYLITNVPGAVKVVGDFAQLAVRPKAHLIIAAAMLLIFLWSIFFTSALNYFLVIVLLAVEYLLLEEKPR